MSQPQPPSPPSIYCFFNDCFNCTTTSCYTTLDPFPFLLPPPPPPPPPPHQPPSSSSHIAPFLIATVSILGISFLLLSTCTIILRLRFTRRRHNHHRRPTTSPASNDDQSGTVIDHPIWHITTVGLQQAVIDSITAFKYDKNGGFLLDSSNNDCTVCLTEFEDGDDLRLLPKCSHAFHVGCIDTWLRSHKNCPLCRAPVVNETEAQSGSGGSGSGVVSFNGSGLGEVVVRVSEDNGGEGSGGGSDRIGEGGLNEILRKNRDFRVFSDLGQNYRVNGLENGLDPVRRSVSFNGVGGLSLCDGVVGNEGSLNEVKKVESSKGRSSNKRGSSMSGLLLVKSNSIRKGPVSMKRSLSSSSKFFSFRRTKSQASILPL